MAYGTKRCELVVFLALLCVGACGEGGGGGGGGGDGGPLNPINTSLTDQNVPATFNASGASLRTSESIGSSSSVLVQRSPSSTVTIDPGAATVDVNLAQNFNQFVHSANYAPGDQVVFGKPSFPIYGLLVFFS